MREYCHTFEYDLGGLELTVMARIDGDTVDLWHIEGPNNIEFDPEGLFVSDGLDQHGKTKYVHLITRLEELALREGEQVA